MTEKDRKNGESERGIGNGTPVPILAPGIGTRIKAASGAFGDRKSAADAAGVSTDMLYRYFREESTPSFSAIVGLARGSGYCLEWLATGEGPRTRESALQETPASYRAIPDSIDKRMDRLQWASRLIKDEIRSELLLKPGERLPTVLMGLLFEGLLAEQGLKALVPCILDSIKRARLEGAHDAMRELAQRDQGASGEIEGDSKNE